MNEEDYRKQVLWFRKQAQDLILEKWVGSKLCPICEHTEWAAYEPQGVVPAIGDSYGITLTMILIPLACENCGFTHLFNAKTLGLTETPGEDFHGHE